MGTALPLQSIPGTDSQGRCLYAYSLRFWHLRSVFISIASAALSCWRSSTTWSSGVGNSGPSRARGRSYLLLAGESAAGSHRPDNSQPVVYAPELHHQVRLAGKCPILRIRVTISKQRQCQLPGEASVFLLDTIQRHYKVQVYPGQGCCADRCHCPGRGSHYRLRVQWQAGLQHQLLLASDGNRTCAERLERHVQLPDRSCTSTSRTSTTFCPITTTSRGNPIMGMGDHQHRRDHGNRRTGSRF